MMEQEIQIISRDYWFKIVDMLQHNWALVDETSIEKPVIYFFGDTAGVFEELEYPDRATAEQALQRNGFKRFEEDVKAQQFISPPAPPFFRRDHPNGLIYSSGKYWR